VSYKTDWDSHEEKVMLVACVIAGLTVGLKSHGVLYGLVAGVGFAITALFVSEFLGEIISKPLARYVFIIAAAVVAFQVMTGPKIQSRGGDLCINTGRIGQEQCIE
jgi:hypothetical protein